MARIIPHCLKQYGIDKIATPMMEFARVITDRKDMVMVSEIKINYHKLFLS